ncbi:hypothetical protein NKI32_29910 [Mesorhizobium sp. M0761]|uniref:hypothetical protein n=1 Tax=Mesorhizobium sp. M0761 TaxID=2956994 RepID=UPI003337FF2E
MKVLTAPSELEITLAIRWAIVVNVLPTFLQTGDGEVVVWTLKESRRLPPLPATPTHLNQALAASYHRLYQIERIAAAGQSHRRLRSKVSPLTAGVRTMSLVARI